jgi:UDP-hydrolysing UDP-N-acetyl-D-glucosamine 2-epimerase
MRRTSRRNVTFVTGTRAEFGLIARALSSIAAHPALTLQIVATGMHLDRSRGFSLAEIKRTGWEVAATVPWPAAAAVSPAATAAATGRAMAGLAAVYARLQTDVVLVVGDRVEAFAAAAAAHVSGLCVAHVHGGDRATGVIDDSLRHAVTKLSHVHFPATAQSAARLLALGEDRWRIHLAGSPGIDGIREDAAAASEVGRHTGPLRRRRFALLALHPAGATDEEEAARARGVIEAAMATPFEHVVAVYPNNDPGAPGIVSAIQSVRDPRFVPRRNLPRGVYLALLRDAAVLLGNSSSGIIEAASFGTPVLDIGPRQAGREHGPNVTHVGYRTLEVRRALGRIWNSGRPVRYPRANPYGRGNAGRRIAATLAGLTIDDSLLRKLIAY